MICNSRNKTRVTRARVCEKYKLINSHLFGQKKNNNSDTSPV